MSVQNIVLGLVDLDRKVTNLGEGKKGDLRVVFSLRYTKGNRNGFRGYVLHADVEFLEHAKENMPAYNVTYSSWGAGVQFAEATRFGAKRLEKEAGNVTKEHIVYLFEKLQARKGINPSEKGKEQLKLLLKEMK